MKPVPALFWHLLVCAFCVLCAPFAHAQVPADTKFLIHFSTETAQTGDTVAIAVRAFGFTDIVSLQLSVNWNPVDLQILRADPTGTILVGFGTTGLTWTQQEVAMGWITPNTQGFTCPDSSLLFRVFFKVKATGTGFLPVKIGPSNLRFEASTQTGFSGPTLGLPLCQQRGGVFLQGTPPNGVLRLHQTHAWAALCNEPKGRLQVQPTGGLPPYTFRWNGPNGFTSTEPNIIGLWGGLYQLTITDQAGQTLTEPFEAYTENTNLALSFTGVKPAHCGGANGCAKAVPSGGAGPYRYNWSVGHTNAQHCALPPGTHRLTVTDAEGCVKIATVEIRDDPKVYFSLSGSQYLIRCGERGFLEAKVQPPAAQGAKFRWNTGDSTARIENLAAGTYELTVTSMLGCTGTGSARVADIYQPYWRLALQPLCAPQGGTGQLLLTRAPNSTITYPIRVAWSDGTERLLGQPSSLTGVDTLRNLPPGAYEVRVSDLDGCADTLKTAVCGATQLARFDTFPFFYLQDHYIGANQKVDTCLGVYARHFKNIEAFDFAVDNSPKMPFRSVRLAQLPDFGPTNVQTSRQKVVFTWQAPNGTPLTLPDSAMLFECCFQDSTGFSGYDHVDLDYAEGHRGFVRGPQGEAMPFALRGGELLLKKGRVQQYHVCGLGAVPPSCAGDGLAQIQWIACKMNTPLGGQYWDDRDTSKRHLEQLKTGLNNTYHLRVWPDGNSGNPTHVSIGIPYELDSTQTCVWPGDADNNDAANHHDLLYLGLGFGATGAPRTKASLDWTGQDAPRWLQQTPQDGVNFQHLDTNGDGTLNADDTLAISQNWGRVINPATNDPFGYPYPRFSGPNPLVLRSAPDTLLEGETALLPLYLGTSGAVFEHFYGLAFSVDYEGGFFEPGMTFVPLPNAWVGRPTDLLLLQRDFPLQTRFDAALTRSNGQAAKGGGLFGYLAVKLRSDIFSANAPAHDTIRHTLLRFVQPQCLNPQGGPEPVAPQSTLLTIRAKQHTNPTAEPKGWAQHIALAPNPAGRSVRVSSPVAPLRRVELLDWRGTALIQQTGDSHVFEMDLAGLAPGSYCVRLFSDVGVTAKVLVVKF